MTEKFIKTQNVSQFWILHPAPQGILIEDIALSLSHICRFTGHTRELYSVAQHCVLASYLVPEDRALSVLLHDAAEAYLGDVAAPLKQFLDHIYAPIENRILDVIDEKYGADTRWSDVRAADLSMLTAEAIDLMGVADPATEWGVSAKIPDSFGPYSRPIAPWSSLDAEITFLSRFLELKK